MRRALPLLAMLPVLCLLGAAQPARAALSGAPFTVASGLSYPWEVLPLPDGRTLVDERPGRIRVIGTDGQLAADPVYADATASKFLGMAIPPDYATDPQVYLYVSHWSEAPGADNSHANEVIRLRWSGSQLVLDPVDPVVFDGGIASDGKHDGGRIAFGPDGKLYVTTGDIHDKDLPLSLTSLNGKILRLNEDGTPPSDNPFFGQGGAADYVWSYGHRHPQGIGWDSRGRMWESEQGPSGAAVGANSSYAEQHYVSRDEINLIVRAGNYGWPDSSGPDVAPGTIGPVAFSGTAPGSAWAPAGLAIGPDGRMYVPGLASTQLLSWQIDGDGLSDKQSLYRGTYGRLRTAVAADGMLWLTTSRNSSNTGDPKNDMVMRVPFGSGAGGNGPQQSGGVAAGGSGAAGSAVAPAISSRTLGALLTGLLGRQASALHRRTARQLAAVPSFAVRDRTLQGKRIAVELVLPRAGRSAVRLAGGSASVASTTTVRLRFRSGARGSLERLASRRRSVALRLVARLRTPDGSLITRTAGFRTRRAG